ncbi:MAG: OFA family MFS transporter [Proteocatella sp.]
MKQNSNFDHKKSKVLNRWIYVVLGIIIMMCLGTVYSYSVFRIPVEAIFGVGTTQSGLPYMTALACYAFFMFLTGKHLDKYNPRIFILIGGGLVSLGWILSSFAPNIYILTLTYGVISGSGVGIAYGAPMTVVAKWFPEKKGLAVGLVLIGFGLSPLITAPLARNLVEYYGIMNTFLILGLSFGVIIAILSYPFKYPSLQEESGLTSVKQEAVILNETDTKNMIKSGSFKALYINFIIGTMIGLTLIGLTNSVGVQLVGLPPKRVTALMAIFAIFNGIGRPIFGWLTDKLSSRKAMLISYSLIILSALLILSAGEGGLFKYAISFSIFWFNLGGWLAIAPTSTMKMYGIKHYSQNYGVVFTAYGIGAITGVVSSGMLLDAHGNFDYVFYFIIALALTGIAVTTKFISDK